MKELSLNILDIANNSIKAGAALLEITITEQGREMTVRIKDDGCGMTAQQVERLADPFFTTRTTRKVGLGIPFFMLAARQTGGDLQIVSVPEAESEAHGTTVTALFYKDHLDFTPLGNIIDTVITIIQGSPDMDLVYTHIVDDKKIVLDIRELRSVLGDISLASYEVLQWIREYLQQQY